MVMRSRATEGRSRGVVVSSNVSNYTIHSAAAHAGVNELHRTQQHSRAYDANQLASTYIFGAVCRNCQTFSTGLSSGHFGGSAIMVMFGGTTSPVDRC